MTNEELQRKIESWSPDPEASALTFTEEESQFLNVSISPENLIELMSKLKSDDKTRFDYLFCLTGVDWGEDLGVVYHLESTQHRHQLVVKVSTPERENPVLATVSSIWKTAEFHEREVFDFFGITFTDHPNMKRLFLTDEWEGYPLRKDYEDEINMILK
ncbi:MAG: NADH-quinone oxidoreductase subunit C [Bacteroidia bacterium]|nr:NADH-quinone oxidoreductase subunit C [Bacteroidia bacterium]